MDRRFSRRDFLKTALTISGGTILAACAPRASGTQAPSSPKTGAAATSAPAVVSGVSKKITFSSYTWSSFEGAVNTILDDFEKLNPGVKVERQLVGGDGYYDKLNTQLAAGTPPDVGIADYGRVVSFAKDGILLDITDMVTSGGFQLDKMVPAAVSHYRWKQGDFDTGASDGRLYGLPSDAQSHIFAYNKKMFDDAGVSYPTDNWTWDDMLAAAKKLTDPSKKRYGLYANATYGATSGLFQMPQRGLWLDAAGAAFHTPDYKKSLLDSTETTEVFKWLWDLIFTHKVSPIPPTTNDVSADPFVTKQAAMSVAGVWWLTDYGNALGPDEWDVAMFPKHPKTGKRTTTVESDGWWVYKGTKEPELSFKLLQYLVDQTGQKKFNDVGYVVPSCFPDVATQWYSQTPPKSKSKILDNMVQDSAKVDTTYFQSATINAITGPIIDKAFTDGTDIVKALKDAASAMNDELAKAWDQF